MVNIILFVLLIVLIIPWPIKKTLKKTYPLILISILVLLIIGFFKSDDAIYVKALDEKNAKSEASEVWLKYIVIDQKRYNPQELLKNSNNWMPDSENRSCLVWRNYDQPSGMKKTLTVNIKDADSAEFQFESNKWRGKVEVKYNGFKKVLDCYSNTSDSENLTSIKIDLAKYKNVNNYNIVEFFNRNLFVLIGFIILFIFFLIFYFYNRRKDNLNLRIENREIWIDLLKILSAFMVVLIHTTGSIFQTSIIGSQTWDISLALNMIPRFAIPCFFMISGMLILKKEEGIKTIFSIRIPRLFLNLVFWSLLFVFIKVYNSETEIIKEIITIPFERKSGHLWYIYQIIGLYLLAPIICKAYKSLSNRIKLYFIILCLFLPSFIDMFGRLFQIQAMEIMPSWQLYISLPYIGLAILGQFIYENVTKIKHYWIIGLFGSVVSIITGILATSYVSKKIGESYMEFFGELRFPSLLLGCCIFILFLSFRQKLRNINIKLKKFIIKISSVSLGIYMIHIIIIKIIGDISLFGIDFSSGNTSVSSVVFGACLYYIISLIVCLMLAEIPIIKKLVR